jgi:hypothetical protein
MYRYIINLQDVVLLTPSNILTNKKQTHTHTQQLWEFCILQQQQQKIQQMSPPVAGLNSFLFSAL